MRWLVASALVLFVSGCIFEDPVISEAVEKKDPGLCLTLEEYRSRRECFHKVAVAAGDRSICDEYSKELYGDAWQMCLSSVAVENDDVSICDSINTTLHKSGCKSDIAIMRNSTSLCEQAEEERDRDDCRSQISINTNNVSLCHEVENEFTKDNCMGKLAKKNSNPQLCQHIESRVMRDVCYDELAVVTDDPGVCDGMSEGNSIACKAKVTGDSGLCDSLDPGKFNVDQCILDAARNSLKESDCARIGTEHMRQICYNNIGGASGRPELCDKSGDLKGFCLKDAAISAANPEYCKGINEVGQRDKCITEATEASDTMKGCDLIEDDERREDCMSNWVEEHPEEQGPIYRTKERIKEKVGEVVANALLGEN
ncbi:MAG: hypothetical protein GF416_04535 [Candidatus Altiarchaeales archaeon]|nr:hypothetical protein [Candidatus Altiarchaeales archaeon]MBD3416387.1 hypothetical protein [Candidatus Altiarchaeales archaeon]